jgi:hypothetical protein
MPLTLSSPHPTPHNPRRTAAPNPDHTLLQPTLLTLRHQASLHPPGSRARNQALNQMIRLIQPHLRHTGSHLETEAIQQTLIYFTKAITTTYDPSLGNILPWLNSYLWYRLRDLQKNAYQRAHQEIPLDSIITYNNRTFRHLIIHDLPSRALGSIDLFNQVRDHIQLDPQGRFQQTYMKSRPDITAQKIILARLLSDKTWKELAIDYQTLQVNLSSFYQRRCIPLLRQCGESENWL